MIAISHELVDNKVLLPDGVMVTPQILVLVFEVRILVGQLFNFSDNGVELTMNIASIILAAGLGKRMSSDLPKVLHPIAEKPMISLLLDTLERSCLSKHFVITGYKASLVEQEVGERAVCVLQKEQLGTGHAVAQAESSLLGISYDYVVVLCGDAPLFRAQTIDMLINRARSKDLGGVVLSMDVADPKGYGRIVEDDQGYVRCIVEEKIANDQEKQIGRVNTGAYCFRTDVLFKALKSVSCCPEVNEYFLTDIVEILYNQGRQMQTVVVADPYETMGINSREELVLADRLFQQRYKEELMRQGVTFVAPELSYVALDVDFGDNVTVEPFAVIHRGSHIPAGTTVSSFSNIEESVTI